MINTLSLAFVILSGYIFAINSLSIRYKLKRLEGWGAYFYVAMWGGVFATLSWLLCSSLSYFDVLRKTYIWMISHDFFEKEMIARLFPLNSVSNTSNAAAAAAAVNFTDLKVAVWGAMSIFLALIASWVVLPFFGWLFWGGDRNVMALARAVDDDHHEGMLIEASVSKFLVMVTLGSRKFYVGIVLCPRFDNGKADYLALIPMLSGYRDKDTLTTHVTSNYKNLYVQSGILTEDGKLVDIDETSAKDGASHKLSLQDFRTLISYDEIEIISFFDSDTYNNFKANEESDKKHSRNLNAYLMPNTVTFDGDKRQR
ncbi:hypothetical protein [Pectobacterium carotovorum]|uniref:hypothetical protein n=1 Tax=Pectobacterium carotovorum TaxID=554 RepID=UPI002B250D01|nr:hypothetical protein [Pectobacterium carotovorum]